MGGLNLLSRRAAAGLAAILVALPLAATAAAGHGDLSLTTHTDALRDPANTEFRPGETVVFHIAGFTGSHEIEVVETFYLYDVTAGTPDYRGTFGNGGSTTLPALEEVEARFTWDQEVDDTQVPNARYRVDVYDASMNLVGRATFDIGYNPDLKVASLDRPEYPASRTFSITVGADDAGLLMVDACVKNVGPEPLSGVQHIAYYYRTMLSDELHRIETHTISSSSPKCMGDGWHDSLTWHVAFGAHEGSPLITELVAWVDAGDELPEANEENNKRTMEARLVVD